MTRNDEFRHELASYFIFPIESTMAMTRTASIVTPINVASSSDACAPVDENLLDRKSSLDKKVRSSLSLRSIADVVEAASEVVLEVIASGKLPKDAVAKCKSVVSTLKEASKRIKTDVNEVSSIPSLGYVHKRETTAQKKLAPTTTRSRKSQSLQMIEKFASDNQSAINKSSASRPSRKKRPRELPTVSYPTPPNGVEFSPSEMLAAMDASQVSNNKLIRQWEEKKHIPVKRRRVMEIV